MNVNFGDITPNKWRIFNELKVTKEQKKFVASNMKILARAFAFR